MSTSQVASREAQVNPRVAVIGGGMAGLVAAYELRKQLGDAAHILIVEAYDRLGGKLKTVDFATSPVDVGAEAYLAFREDFTELLIELGLEAQLREPSGLPSGLFIAGSAVDIPQATIMGIPARGVDVVDVIGQAAADRVDAERAGTPMTWVAGQDVTVGELIEARMGRAVVDQLVSPLLGGVYSCGADDLGVRSTLPQLATALDAAGANGAAFFLTDVIAQMLDERNARAAAADEKIATGQQPKRSVFRAVEGGYAAIVDALLERTNPEIIFNTPVESLGATEQGWYLEPVGVFDAVVIATPAPVAAMLLNDQVPAAAERLGEVALASSVVVAMRFASHHGIPQRSGVLLGEHSNTEAKAFTFASRKWPHLSVNDSAVVRASFGTLHEPWYLDVEDRVLLRYALDDLARVTGERKEPEEYFVQRWWGGLPQYGVNHLQHMEEVRATLAEIPGLAVAGSMMRGVGVPATAQSGREAAMKILHDLRGS